ncbi:hypothetical protein RO3G_08285 [Rhizopus delemar RA 99-880]|uniref:Uncharacterized protein n=1 Tax=Rhizopus delemar (strain RA 99-880 / ATCC MYA-4621 / FGSC 9543 / NRRL 43880) TaxID=246409 RepID=I1C550_RHIO9|nr:hypothetical protein RO3G_08285 [Rhizopus delemar RA 99-880]|eukprot:EIE83580.1 hypothetical protein RO3G_08285 [Rhizopus delemar RA 99-880]
MTNCTTYIFFLLVPTHMKQNGEVRPLCHSKYPIDSLLRSFLKESFSVQKCPFNFFPDSLF